LLSSKIELTIIYTCGSLFLLLLGFTQIFIPEMIRDLSNYVLPIFTNYVINQLVIPNQQIFMAGVRLGEEVNANPNLLRLPPDNNIVFEEEERDIRIENPLNTNMQVTPLDHMGTDLTIVNAARCSFGKKKEIMDKSDEKLIKFLAKHGHWSPFGHTSIQFHIKAPIFVTRQLGKHQVGLIWNEISRRYVDSDPEFYTPTAWRLRAENVKQGSSNETIKYSIDMHNKACLDIYNDMLSKNIAPEMARMILPQNMMTEFWLTGSLYAFVRICKLRLSPDTQWETKQIALQIAAECKKLYPISWNAFFSEEIETTS